MPQVEKTAVVIIGAGPAGCMASFQLAAENIPHIILEQAVFPRDKICGDALSGKVIDSLLELKPELVQKMAANKQAYQPTPGIRFFAPNGKHLDIPFPERKDGFPAGFVAKRSVFDMSLFESIDPHHATVYQGVKGIELKRIENGIEVDYYSGETLKTIQAPLVLGCDGARSVVRRDLFQEQADSQHESGAIRAYFENVTGFHEDFIELHFLKDFLPGYLWVFPLPNGAANVGIGMLSRKIKKKHFNLRKIMLEQLANHPLLKDRFSNAELEGQVRGWTLPLGSRQYPISCRGAMLCGDAASLIDPFTGEGIGNAFVSARLAVNTALKARKMNDFSSDVLIEYDRAVYKKLWDELKLSSRLQKLSAIPPLFNFLVNRTIANEELQKAMTGMFVDLDSRAKLRDPRFYLNLLWKAKR